MLMKDKYCEKCGENFLECICVLHAFECECEICKEKWKKAQDAIDAIYIRVPIEYTEVTHWMPLPKPTKER